MRSMKIAVIVALRSLMGLIFSISLLLLAFLHVQSIYCLKVPLMSNKLSIAKVPSQQAVTFMDKELMHSVFKRCSYPQSWNGYHQIAKMWRKDQYRVKGIIVFFQIYALFKFHIHLFYNFVGDA